MKRILSSVLSIVLMGGLCGVGAMDLGSLQGALLSMSSKQAIQQKEKSTHKDDEPNAEYEKSVVIVQYRGQISVQNVKARCENMGLQDLKIRPMKAISRTLGKSVFILKSASHDTGTLIRLLRQDPDIEKVQPSYRRKLLQTPVYPDDANFSNLWGLHNTGQEVNGRQGIADADIDAPEAWDIEKGSKDVVVAVFDTGVDYKHEDLIENMWINDAELNGQSGVDDDNNGYVDDIYGYDFGGDNDSDPMDENGHGTHVAGTIGAKGNNAKGVTGINWNVSIMALKIFSGESAYDSDITEAIDYVLAMKDKGVNIVAINASYGGYGGSQDDVMNDLIKILGSKGIVFCAASANDNLNNDYIPAFPASYNAPNIIAVDASDMDDTMTYFSNYGYAATDIFAPGNTILSTIPGATADVVEWHTHDDFESGVDNWRSESPWRLTEADSYSPTNSWTTGAYDNNQNASLAYNVTLDLQNYMQNAEENESVIFGACFKGELEQNFDKVYLEYSADSGNSWKTGGYVSGVIPNWSCFYQEIKELSDQNRVRFRFFSDTSITKSGYFLDDFFIAKAKMTHNRYAYFAGTSMATPHVTGAVALMAAHYPDENAYERISRILGGAEQKASFAGLASSKGRLNLANSLQLLQLPPYLMDINETQGADEGKVIKLSGVHFGDVEGRVYFETNGSQKIEAQIVGWSNSEIRVKIPKLERASFVRVESADGERSVNTFKVTRWEELGRETDMHLKGTSVAIGEKIYRIGGVDNPTSVDIYDIASRSWSQGSASPFTYTDGVVRCAAYSSDIYCLGRDGNGAALFARYSTQADSWTRLAQPSYTLKDGYGVVATPDGIHVIGGIDDNHNVRADHLLFNPTNGEWIQKAPLPEARDFMTLIVHEGKIYAFGGVNESEVYRSDVYVYDSATNSWSQTADMPFVNAGAVGFKVRIDNAIKFAFIGGRNSSRIFEGIMLFDPQNNSWESATYSPFIPNFSLRVNAASVRVEDSVYLFSGSSYRLFPDETKTFEKVYAPLQVNDDGSDAGDDNNDGDNGDGNDSGNDGGNGDGNGGGNRGGSGGGSGGGGGGLPAGNPWMLLALFLGFTLFAARRIASSRA